MAVYCIEISISKLELPTDFFFLLLKHVPCRHPMLCEDRLIHK